MSLVSPARFNELRFADDPQPLTKLWRWCREKRVPARKIGGDWFIDLDAFDRQKDAEKQADAPVSADTPRMVVELLAASARR